MSDEVTKVLLKPTSRTIDKLFREINSRGYAWYQPEVKELQAQIEDLKERLLADKELQKMEKTLQKMVTKYDNWSKEWELKVQCARQRYYANGLTPEVLKQIQELVEEYHAADRP